MAVCKPDSPNGIRQHFSLWVNDSELIELNKEANRRGHSVAGLIRYLLRTHSEFHTTIRNPLDAPTNLYTISGLLRDPERL